MAAAAVGFQRNLTGLGGNLVYGPLIIAVGLFETPGCYVSGNGGVVNRSGEFVDHIVYLPDPGAAAEAAELIERFGAFAAGEAAARADRSRELGNIVHFCRWRQIERMILLLAADGTGCTIH